MLINSRLAFPSWEENQPTKASNFLFPKHTPLQSAAVEEEVALQQMQGSETLCTN